MYNWNFEEREWVEVPSGNYCCNDGGEHVATVFTNKWGDWGIIISGIPFSKLVLDEHFVDADAAIERAGEILDGADYLYKELVPRFG